MAIKILGDIVSVVSEHISNPNKSGYQIFVGLEHYDSGEPVITRHGSTEQLESSVKHFIEGDILVARRNVYLKRAGVVNFEGVTSGDSIVLRVKEEKYKDIIPFILNTDDFWDYAEQNSDGTMSKRLAPDVLLEYECNIPENHQSIADKLWAAYKLKVSYRQMITATDEMVKSQFIEMFGSESNKVLLEDVVFVKDDYRKPINEGVRSEMKEGELYPYYGATGVVDYINDYITDEELLCVAEDCGNYNAGEESAYIIRGKAWVNNHAHLVKMKDSCDIKYLYYYLKIANLMPYVSGTTRLKLTQKKLREIPVVLPTKDKQTTFVAIAEQADKSKFELRKSIEAIDAVIKSLING